MIEKISQIVQQFQSDIADAANLDLLKEVESRFFGKKGEFTALLKSLKDCSNEEKKEFGQKLNQIRAELTKILNDRREAMLAEDEGKEYLFDTTVPGSQPERGSLHPIVQMMYDLNDAFLSLGFEVFEGPEISSEFYAFDCLNFPENHPARESMDTYWLDGYENNKAVERLCLRPHLTGGSVRYMQSHKPPFRFVYPGRVFRNESTDAGHERAFFQYEALIIDRQVPFSAVRLMVNTILERVFGEQVKTRMRTGFFPFVEPGFEIDMQCLVCKGKGCSVCGQTGWVEMMPGGPPHPNVMKAGGIDSEKWQGMYINIGLDRLTMMKYGINDVRLFHSTDLRFLQQF